MTRSTGVQAVLGDNGYEVPDLYDSKLTRHAAEHAAMGGAFRSEMLSYRNRFGGVVWSDPSAQLAGDYQVVGAGSSISMSTTVARSGSQTLKVTVNRGSAAGTDINVLHAVSAQITAHGRIGVWLYIENYTLLSSIILKCSHGDTNYTNGAYQTYSFSDSDKKFNGWHFVAFDLSEWGGAYGTPNWATTVNAIRITINQNSSTSTNVYIDQYVVGWSSRARLLIFADDGYANWFEKGIPVLNSMGLRSTSAIIGAQIDSNATWATTEQLREAYANGHDLCAHGGAALDSLSDTAARASDIASNIAFLSDLGFNRGLEYYVYPNGVYQLSAGNEEIFDLLRAAGIKAARGTTSVKYLKTQGDHVSGMNMLMPILGVSAATAVSTITGYLDTLAAHGSVGALMYHEIVTSGASGATQRNLSDFLTEMEYVRTLKANGKLQDVTGSEYIWSQGL